MSETTGPLQPSGDLAAQRALTDGVGAIYDALRALESETELHRRHVDEQIQVIAETILTLGYEREPATTDLDGQEGAPT